MYVMNVRNPHEALAQGLLALTERGVERDTRNGPVIMFDQPLTTVYSRPTERVVFWADRDANPFFHLFESLWMLAGRDDVKFVERFVKRMRSFSDDGKTLHGAYGKRWRSWFSQIDQLETIITLLAKNPEDRRCVLGMWDPNEDLGRQGKDVPCNTQAYFSVNHEGRVDMMVLNRSNDLVWGAYGANAVHFSYLHEYVARRLERDVGVYRQVSNNLHAYKDTLQQVIDIPRQYLLDGDQATAPNPYQDPAIRPFPLMTVKPELWAQDLAMFMDHGPIIGLNDPFFKRVVTPMWMAHRALKEGEGVDKFDAALEICDQIRATDWQRACIEWLQRRREIFLRAVDDGPNYEV